VSAPRTTKGNVQSAFKYLCEALGKQIATDYNDEGAWRLDYDYYGGYNIEEISNPQERYHPRGVHHPLGSTRMTASEFYHAAWFAIRAVELVQKQVTTTNKGEN
jgi:hypothetical protein